MISPLTSLRFVFALMVYMSHAIIFDQDDSPFLYHIFYEGYVGVSFFFILSGFILAYTYQDKFSEKLISKRFFYTARFARIYPLHILTLLIWVYMRKDHPLNEPYFTNLFANVFLLQSFYPTEEIRFNAVAWSLSAEMFFYILFPFIIQWITTTVRSKIYTIFMSATIFMLVLCAVFGGTENELWFFYGFPPVRLLDFVLGIILYNLCKKINIEEFRKRFSFTAIEISAIVLFVAFFISAYYIPQVYRHALWYWLPVGLLISIFSFQSGCISKLLSNNTFVYLGEISFSFYMFHTIVLWYVKRAFFLLNIEATSVTIFFLGIFISIIVSALSYNYFEVPINKWVKKKFAQR